MNHPKAVCFEVNSIENRLDRLAVDGRVPGSGAVIRESGTKQVMNRWLSSFRRNLWRISKKVARRFGGAH